MTKKNLMPEYGMAICYSGYRENQSPITRVYPSDEEIHEDLLILAKHWRYLRLYDSSPHAEAVLRIIDREKLPFKVMLGVDLGAEVNNPGCPWGGDHSDEKLFENRRKNHEEIERAIALTNDHSDTVFSISIGNEASVEWTDHMVPVDHLIAYARQVKSATHHPVTFCENYVPWLGKLEELAAELDFLSLHTYPVWEYRSMHDALQYTQENYYSVHEKYPDKPVVITEAGWCTNSNGRGIEPHNASEEHQAQYYDELLEWIDKEKILTFVFEAFDEPWKGSDDPMEPEKHWGLFHLDRTPKLVMKDHFPELLPD